MMIKLSWYNIWRNKKRSVLIILMITVGLSSGLFVYSLVKVMSDQRIRTAIDNELAHIQIHLTDYLNNSELKDTIRDAGRLHFFLGSLSQLEGFSCRIKTNGLVSEGQKLARVKIYGIHPTQEMKVTSIHNKLIAGNYLASDSGNFIIVGQSLAEKLKLGIDSLVNLQLINLSGSFIECNYKIIGIYKTDNYLFDNNNVFLEYKNLAQNLEVNNGIHEILIKLAQASDLPRVQNLIRNRFPGLNVQSWKEISPELRIMTDYMDILLRILLVIILTSISFAVVNTMVMSINARLMEFGMLLAIGMNKLRIIRMIIFETMFLCLIGGIVGLGVGWGIIQFFGYYGVNLNAFSKGLSAIGVRSVVYPALNYSSYWNFLIVVFGVALFSSIFSAFKAFKLKLSETIKFYK